MLYMFLMSLQALINYKDKATIEESKYIPRGGYKQFLKPYGLKGKRLDFLRNGFFNFNNGSLLGDVFESFLVFKLSKQKFTIVSFKFQPLLFFAIGGFRRNKQIPDCALVKLAPED